MSVNLPELSESKRRPLRHSQRLSRRIAEGFIENSLFLCGLFSVGITIAIAFVLIEGSLEFFGKTEIYYEIRGEAKYVLEKKSEDKEAVIDRTNSEDLVIEERTSKKQIEEARKKYKVERESRWMSGSEIWTRFSYFFTGTVWDDVTSRFGVIPLVIGTLWIAIIAGLVAIPIGLVTAIYLSEYASPRVRSFAKPALELLAGIPSIVYGFFALTVVTPLLASPFSIAGVPFQPIIPGLNNPFNQISGGLVVGIMIIPMVASLSEDALRAVPRSLRDGAVALGATKFETSIKVVVPAALSGIVASFILAMSRAIGETMAVSLACGEKNDFTLDPRQGITTLTSFIVRRAKGEMEHGTTEYNCLFAVGLLLFAITLGMNFLAQKIQKRYRQVYQ